MNLKPKADGGGFTQWIREEGQTASTEVKEKQVETYMRSKAEDGKFAGRGGVAMQRV